MLKIYKILLSTVICVSYGNTMHKSNYYLDGKNCCILQSKRSIENIFQNSLNDSLESSLKETNIIHTENNSHNRAQNTFDSSQYMHVYTKQRISKTLDKNNKRRQCNVIKNIYNEESLKASSKDTLLYNNDHKVIPTAFNVIPFDGNKPILLMPTNNSLMQNLTHNNRKDIKKEDNIINNKMNTNNIAKLLDNRTRTINNESNKQNAIYISKQEFMNIVQQQFKDKDDDINTNNNDNLINNILTENDIQTSGNISNRPKMNNIYLKNYMNINSKSAVLKHNTTNAISSFNNKPIIINDNNNQNESNNNFAYYDNSIMSAQTKKDESIQKRLIDELYKDNKNLNNQIVIPAVNDAIKLLDDISKNLSSNISESQSKELKNKIQTIKDKLCDKSVNSNDNIESNQQEKIELNNNNSDNSDNKKIAMLVNDKTNEQIQKALDNSNKKPTLDNSVIQNNPVSNTIPAIINNSTHERNKSKAIFISNKIKNSLLDINTNKFANKPNTAIDQINNIRIHNIYNKRAQTSFIKNRKNNILNKDVNILNKNKNTNNNLILLKSSNNNLPILPNTNQIQNTNGFDIVKNENFSINQDSVKNSINNNIILSINKENDMCINKKPKQTKDVETQTNIIQEQVTTVTTTTYTKKYGN